MTRKKTEKRTLEQIVQEQLPSGWTVVHGRMQDTRRTPPRGDTLLPNLDELRAKYIGERSSTKPGGAAPRALADTGVRATKTEVVQIQNTGGNRKLNERVGVKKGKIAWKTG